MKSQILYTFESTFIATRFCFISIFKKCSEFPPIINVFIPAAFKLCMSESLWVDFVTVAVFSLTEVLAVYTCVS